MAAEDEIGTRFHHKCSGRIRLSDGNKTATGQEHGWSGTSFRRGTVFSSLPLHKLPMHRFVFKEQRSNFICIWQIGVTRSDPGELEEIPQLASDVPQTWCIEPDTGWTCENSSRVDTGEVTKVTQQEGDVWCVKVTPGGQVYIYHNYNQPWGSPVFTLPPDTTQVWAVVTLHRYTTIFVVRNHTDRMLDVIRHLKLVKLQSPTDESCLIGSEDSDMEVKSKFEWIKAVDRATRIPAHTVKSDIYPRDENCSLNYKCPRITIKEVCGYCAGNNSIYQAVETVVLWVKSEIEMKLGGDIHFQLQAMGSYIQETKVLDNNEFDFMLIFQRKEDIDVGFYTRVFESYQDFFKKVCRQFEVNDAVVPNITSVYPHGPAWCLEISWITEMKEHKISVDITLGFRQEGLAMKEYCKNISRHRYFSKVFDSLQEDVIFVNLNPSDPGYTNATVYFPLFSKLNDINPNVLCVMRVLKVLVATMFPKRVVCSEHRKCGYEETNFISSHEITDCVLRYMDKHLQLRWWKTKYLPQRISAILVLLKDKTEPVGYIRDDQFNLEQDIFRFLIDFFGGVVPDTKRDRYTSENLDCFAVVKQRFFKKVADRTIFLDMLEPDDQSKNTKRELLAYMVFDNNLISETSSRNFMKLFFFLKTYLLGKLHNCPMFNIEEQADEQNKLDAVEKEQSTSRYDDWKFTRTHAIDTRRSLHRSASGASSSRSYISDVDNLLTRSETRSSYRSASGASSSSRSYTSDVEDLLRSGNVATSFRRESVRL